MLEPHAKDPWADFRQLSPEQWERHNQRLIQLAHEARTQPIGYLARRFGRAVRSVAERGGDVARSFASRAAVTASRWASGYAAWRERRRALRALAALDDRVLNDIGSSRSEIQSAGSCRGARCHAVARRDQRSHPPPALAGGRRRHERQASAIRQGRDQKASCLGCDRPFRTHANSVSKT